MLPLRNEHFKKPFTPKTFLNNLSGPPTMERNCISCGRSIKAIKGSVVLKCPACPSTEISRCADCRAAGTPYTCSSCGFTGP